MQTSAIRHHVAFYVRQHGTAALARVVWSRLWSATIGTPEWLYSIDLEGFRSCAPSISDPSDLAVVPFHSADELDAPTIAQLQTFKSELSLRRFLKSWFDRRAVLWVTYRSSRVVGVLWTLRGGMAGM